jgi:Uma2 family endonuclease
LEVFMSTAILPSLGGTGVAPGVPLLTAEEFVERYEGQRVELVRGVVEELPMPWNNHGFICWEIALALGAYIKAHDLGRISTNDSWMRTRRNPDTVRGPDVGYFSYARQPKGPVPEGFLERSPELVVEVKSPSDSWPKILAKANEYLAADVLAVVLLDPETHSATVCRPGVPPAKLEPKDALTLPELLPGFTVIVGSLFQ